METQVAQTAEKPKKLLDGYIPEADLARGISYEVRTLRKWRQTGEGPPYVLIGKSVYYPEAEFQKWLAKRVRNTAGR